MITYFVFENGSGKLIVRLSPTRSKLSPLQARILAIEKLNGHSFPEGANSQQVADYVTNNIYNTKLWGQYQFLFNECRLIETEAEKLLYEVKVKLVTGVSPENKAIMKMIGDYLQGEKLQTKYIVSVEKD